MLGIFNLPFLIFEAPGYTILQYKILLLILFDIITGFTSVLPGVVCGLLIVPFHVLIVGFEIQEAIMLSLTTIFFLALTGTIVHKKHKMLDFSSVRKMFIPALTGAIFGAFFAKHLPGNTLKFIFAVFLLLIALKYIIEECLYYLNRYNYGVKYEYKKH